MNNNPIGVFDSGMGGISVLKEILKVLPNENYIYYGDDKNNPYGSKDSDTLFTITSNIVEYLLSRNCKMIVIACNTATTVCMKELREKFKDTIFIGIVPAIKVACDHHSKETLVVATPYTIKSKRVDELITNYKKEDQNITLVPCHTLANTIETKDGLEVDECLQETLKDFIGKNYDTVVLGCTHYSLIKEKFQNLFPDSEIVDGNNGVAKEVKRNLEKNQIQSLTNNGNVEFVSSNGNIEKYQKLFFN